MEILTWTVLIKPIIIICILLFTINFLISHAFEPTYKNQMSGIKKEGELLSKKHNKIFDNLVLDFRNNKMSKEEYFIQLDLNKKTYSKLKKEFKQKRKNKRSEISYNGYISKRMFKFWVGVGFFIMFISFRFAMEKIKNSNLFEKIEVIIYCSISGFMFTWTLLNFNDYKNSTYLVWMIGLNIAISIFAFLIIKYHKNIEEKLKKAIRLLTSYISKDLYNEVSEKNKKKRLIQDLNKYDELTKIIK